MLAVRRPFESASPRRRPWHAVHVAWCDGMCRQGPVFRRAGRNPARATCRTDHPHILAVAPIPNAVGPHPSAQRQAAQLTAQGAEITLLTPDREARRAMGRDLTTDARRPAAARAGYAQAMALADGVHSVWRGGG